MSDLKVPAWDELAGQRFKAWVEENDKPKELWTDSYKALVRLYFLARRKGFESEETFEGLSQLTAALAHECIAHESAEGTFE